MVLPQGQFARFLHDKPRDRQDLLVRLLDLGLYDRVASAARQRSALDRNAAEVAGGQLAQLAGATPEARAAAADRVAALAALGERLAADRPTLDALDQAARRAGEQAEAVAGHARLLAALAAPPGVDALAADLAEAAAARARCAVRGEEAAAAVEAAEARLAELPERRGVEALRTDHARRAELADVQERGERAAAEAADALAAAAEVGDRAGADLAARTAEREHARVEHRAQALVPALVVGEDCPVCGQQVRDLPAHEAPADLARAERLVDDATRAAESALATVSEARTHQARVDEKLDRVRAERAEVDARLAKAPDAAAVEHALALLDEAATALDKARQADRDARREITAADTRVRALGEREAEARRAFDRTRDGVAALAPPPRSGATSPPTGRRSWRGAPNGRLRWPPPRPSTGRRRTRPAPTPPAASRSWPRPAPTPASRSSRGPGPARPSPPHTPGQRATSPAWTSSWPTPSACGPSRPRRPAASRSPTPWPRT